MPQGRTGPERPATAQPDATRLQEHGERETRAVRLLREGSGQFLYLIAHRRESAVAAWFSISRVLSESLPGLAQPLS